MRSSDIVLTPEIWTELPVCDGVCELETVSWLDYHDEIIVKHTCGTKEYAFPAVNTSSRLMNPELVKTTHNDKYFARSKISKVVVCVIIEEKKAENMIDKKPFRVTNEESKAFSECAVCPDSRNCNPAICAAFDICNDYNTNLFNVSADLNDARELIDKQEALIKEMRDVLHATRNAYSEELLSYAKSRHDELLEKTKDFA